MNDLNVFKKRFARGLFKKTKQFFYNLRAAYQRATRGFSDYDWWDMDKFYLTLMRDSLKHFARNTTSHPINYAPGEWEDKLIDLSNRLDYILKDNDEENEYAQTFFEYLYKEEWRSTPKEIFEPYSERDRIIAIKKFKMIKEVFAELGEILPDLWD